MPVRARAACRPLGSISVTVAPGSGVPPGCRTCPPTGGPAGGLPGPAAAASVSLADARRRQCGQAGGPRGNRPRRGGRRRGPFRPARCVPVAVRARRGAHARQRRPGAGCAGDREELVAAGGGHDATGGDRRDQQPADEREHEQAGHGRAHVVDRLQEEAEVGDRAEQRDPGDQPDQARDVEDAAAEQVPRDDRLGRVPLGEQEQRCQDDEAGPEADDDGRAPGVGGAAPDAEQHDAGRRGGQQEHAEDVEPGAVVVPGQVQREDDHGQRDDPDRDVDIEDPAPAHVVGQVAADQRARDGRDAEYGADEAYILAPLTRRHHVPDDRLRPDHQAAGAHALQRAEGDQLVHVLGQAGQHRAGQEDTDREDEQALAAEQVPQLAVDRQPDRRRQQVGGRYPGQLADPVQVPDDGRERGGHDRLVQRGEKHRQHQRDEDDGHIVRDRPPPGRLPVLVCRRSVIPRCCLAQLVPPRTRPCPRAGRDGPRQHRAGLLQPGEHLRDLRRVAPHGPPVRQRLLTACHRVGPSGAGPGVGQPQATLSNEHSAGVVAGPDPKIVTSTMPPGAMERSSGAGLRNSTSF